MPTHLQPPVIVVPGIQGTGLEDYYPLPREELWSAVVHKEYERISIHPDDSRYEVIEPARVQPSMVFDLIYRDLIAALRHDLTPRKDQPTPVFGFAYDWRQDCARSADQLGDFVEEVLARTALLPHYRKDPPTRLDMVAHSMGGLIVADYLSRNGTKKRVRRVASIATPFEGAVDAVVKLATGMGNLAGERPRERDREAARTIPAVYQLLPTFAGATRPDPELSGDILDVTAWQRSVLETLAAYIRFIKASNNATALLTQYLRLTRDLRKHVRSASVTAALSERSKGWLAIVGVNVATQTSFRITRKDRRIRFEFDANQDQWPDGMGTGDGTVPFLGACPAFLDRAQLVCVRPDDFSFWELKDRVLTAVGGFHAALPTMNLVQHLVLRFLREDFRGQVWGWKAPGVAKQDWPAWIVPGRDRG
ncbi:MAG: esterase/lipase family protein [Gemmatimonadaceae bacterium]